MNEELLAAADRVMQIAEEFRGVIYEKTGVMITGENFCRRYKYFQLKQISPRHYQIAAEKIYQMTDKEILESLWEYANDAKKAVKKLSASKRALTPNEKKILQQISDDPNIRYKEIGNEQVIKNLVSKAIKDFNCRNKKDLVKFLRESGQIK
jgi:DNA-binding CsgD family transcriptional regulator